MIHIARGIAIGEDEIEEAFVRAGGPGGQNVNKVATAVQLRFDAARSAALDERARQRLRLIAGRRLTADGVLIIDARRFRTQERNRADAHERLLELLRRAVEPGKRRIATRPTAAARAQRLADKTARGRTKRLRTTPEPE